LALPGAALAAALPRERVGDFAMFAPSYAFP
jgi:hypothetical protein